MSDEPHAFFGSPEDWFGVIPSHWAFERADRLLCVAKSQVKPSDLGAQEVFHYSIPAFQDTGTGIVETADSILSDKFLIDQPTLLVSKLNPRKGAVLIAEPQSFPTICSTEFIPLVSRNLDLKFAYYLFISNTVRAIISSTVRSVTRSHQRAEPEEITKITLPVPSLGDQRSIAEFLDRETAKIDALIAKQDDLIRQIDLKRTADIRATLAHGLRPNVSLRQSGVDWIGSVPEHWKVARLGSQATIVRGASPRPAGDTRYFGSDFCPWITVASITGGRGKYVAEAEDFLTPEGVELSRRIPADTLLLSNSGYSLGIPRIIQFSGCINDGCLAIWPHAGVQANSYFYYVLEQMTGMLRLRLKQGNDQPNLNTDLAKAIMVPVPPPGEMVEISDYLDRRFEEYERLRAAAREFVSLLFERRSALITAAVTGQIEVAANLAGEAAA